MPSTQWSTPPAAVAAEAASDDVISNVETDNVQLGVTGIPFPGMQDTIILSAHTTEADHQPTSPDRVHVS